MGFGRLALCLGLAGCVSVGPDYQAPRPELPAAWVAADEASPTTLPDARLARWWEMLEDPLLTDLIDRALSENLDLHSAYQRVREARARRQQSTGQRFPDLDGTGSYSRTRVGTNSFPALPDAKTFDLWSVGLEAGWELDLWGRVRRVVEAADADLMASVEDARDVRVLVAAEVARQYIDVRVFQARLDVARGNIELQQRSLGIAQDRFREGISPALDVAQAETNLANTESEIPSLESGLRAATLRLGVLLGELPAALLEELMVVASVPVPPASIDVGVPAELLRQRPDVRAAERALAAQVAQIGVAIADLYPRFQLGGRIGYEATDTENLIQRNSGFLGIGPAFSWNLFDGGRVRGNIEAQRARAESARLAYRSAVLMALEEVEATLFAHARERERSAALNRAVVAARRTVDLARELYTAGRSDFQNVLDAERSLFLAEDRSLASRGQVALTYVSLQRALGGGWQEAAP